MTPTGARRRLSARLTDCSRQLRVFFGSQGGASFVVTALTFPVLLGMAGLGIDGQLDRLRHVPVAEVGLTGPRLGVEQLGFGRLVSGETHRRSLTVGPGLGGQFGGLLH